MTESNGPKFTISKKAVRIATSKFICQLTP